MKKKLVLFLAIGMVSSLFSQSKIENYLEGRKFKNSATGLIIKYGYISSLNTYGITFVNGYGNQFYFINCSNTVSDDESYLVLSGCMSVDNGEGLGRIYVYRKKIIIVASDGKLEYDLIDDNQDDGYYQNKKNKPSKGSQSKRSSIKEFVEGR